MRKRYAVAASESVEPHTITDCDEEWLIVSELPDHAHDYEALIELDAPTVTPLFTDYGFTSFNGRVYLYESLVTAFTIVAFNKVETDMFLLQLEEYMIAQEQTIYYIAKHHQPLLEKTAATYRVAIHIFDLDKYRKND
ncbi:hypothetical protein [Anoxybacillus sp. J5B_2022]|uniref:hypothetical protein n=1 Tax=Anoxybacillus sp. J5B_2022 TaxID=3003246 RepID=UPI002285418F|nr:hypothetical protein [Anoxybacillus sp. J5B_2022]MCZ0754631.1 hypothetical protein [Anoxybacillus sp. J5B_2022]